MRFLSFTLRVVPAALLLALALATAGGARAAEEASFSLKPASTQSPNSAYFVYDAEPGQVIHDEVLVTNTGDAPGTVQLAALDGMTGQTGGIVFPDADAPRAQVGAWTRLDQTELTLEPGESRTVGFTLTVPREVRAGHHVGGIAAQGVAVKQGSGQFQVNVQTRVVTAVQVNLPGPVVEHLAIDGVTPTMQGSRQALLLGLRNDGNRMLKPHGTLTVTDSQGQELHSIPLQLNTFLPDTAIAYPAVVLDGPLAAGEYAVAVRLQYGEEGTASYEGTLTISSEQAAQAAQAAPAEQPATIAAPAGQAMPLWLIAGGVGAGVLVGLLLASGAVLLWQRRAAARQPAAPAATGARMGTIRPLIGRSQPARRTNGDD